MKNLFIINELSNAAIYGIGTFINQYVECLKKAGNIAIHIIDLNSYKSEFSIEEDKEVKRFIFPFTNSDRDKYYKSIARLLKFYITDSEGNYFHFNYSGCEILVNKLKDYFPSSKMILSVHYLNWTWPLNGNEQKYKNIIHRRQQKAIQNKYKDLIESHDKFEQMLLKMDHICCLSDDTFAIIHDLHKIPTEKISLLPNGMKDRYKKYSDVQKNNIRKEFLIEESEQLILFVGRLDKMKGIISLLHVFREIVNANSNVRLIIIGSAGKMEQAIMECKPTWSKVIFTGRLSQKEVYKWYSIADIGIFPSFSEECSYVGVEMMMFKLPIIASDGRGIKNMFKENENALIAHIDPKQKSYKNFEQQLKEHLLHLLSSKEAREKYSKLSRKTYLWKYTEKNMEKNYRKLLEQPL